MINRPRLSIIIPTHARPTLVKRAVRSVLSTSRSDIEVLVVEDNATCAAEELQDLGQNTALRVISRTGPRGASGTRNAGVAQAQADVILFLDDDDALFPDYIDKVLSLSARSDLSWGFARQARRVENGSWYDHKRSKDKALGLLGAGVPFNRKIAASSAGFWIRRRLFQDIGGFCIDLRMDEDTDLCCRLIAAGHPPWRDAALSVILDRVGSHPRLTNSTDAGTRAECYLRTFERNAQALASEPGARFFLAERAQRAILRGGQQDQMLQHLYAQFPNTIWARYLKAVGPARALYYTFRR